MRWWLWVVLALLAVVVLILGVAYAVVHAINAGKDVSKTASALSVGTEHLMGAGNVETAEPRDPVFTGSLREAARAYSEAQTKVVERRLKRRAHHERTWRRWNG
jgi:2-iminoacetate synthase ThiH